MQCVAWVWPWPACSAPRPFRSLLPRPCPLAWPPSLALAASIATPAGPVVGIDPHSRCCARDWARDWAGRGGGAAGWRQVGAGLRGGGRPPTPHPTPHTPTPTPQATLSSRGPSRSTTGGSSRWVRRKHYTSERGGGRLGPSENGTWEWEVGVDGCPCGGGGRRLARAQTYGLGGPVVASAASAAVLWAFTFDDRGLFKVGACGCGEDKAVPHPHPPTPPVHPPSALPHNVCPAAPCACNLGTHACRRRSTQTRENNANKNQ